MENDRRIIATIVVTHNLSKGIIAKVNGRARWFPDLAAVFRAALALQDAETTCTIRAC